MRPIYVVIAGLGCAAAGFLAGMLVRADVRVSIDTDLPLEPVVERSR